MLPQCDNDTVDLPTGHIYKITDNETNRVYIGSSYNIDKRLHNHINRDKTSALVWFNINNYTIEIIDTISYISIIELKMLEQEYIDNIPLDLRLNKNRAYVSPKDKYKMYEQTRSPNSKNCILSRLIAKRKNRVKSYYKKKYGTVPYTESCN